MALQLIERSVLNDPNESWFVKEAALRLVALAPADTIVRHIDVILPYLEHEEWWLQHSALVALTPVVADERVSHRLCHTGGVTTAGRVGFGRLCLAARRGGDSVLQPRCRGGRRIVRGWRRDGLRCARSAVDNSFCP